MAWTTLGSRTATEPNRTDDGEMPRSAGNSSDACDVHEVATRPLRIAPVFDVNREVKQTPARKVTRSRLLRFPVRRNDSDMGKLFTSMYTV